MISQPERIEPAPGQESVWDYPRPPRLEPVEERLRVVFAGRTVAETMRGYRVLETSHPPVYYIPPDAVEVDCHVVASCRSFCEFKGAARFWHLDAGGRRAENAVWSYPDPAPAFAPIKDHFAYYPSRVDECWVGEELVTPQVGDFYGGWITSRVVGPFKGAPGTAGW